MSGVQSEMNCSETMETATREKKLPEGYMRRFLIGLFPVLLFVGNVIVFSLIIKFQSPSIQPYLLMNQTVTDNVIVVKSIMIHKGEGNWFEKINGMHACLTKSTCMEKCIGRDK